jgi:hypothetical protein
MENFRQEEYLRFIADFNYKKFLEQGHATAGHNGPHGHIDTPVRNTAHYLIIYTYLYKITGNEGYRKICSNFADYLCKKQMESETGAIKCIVDGEFDHLNGLIGQGWVIEGLLYYYSVFKEEQCLLSAKSIFFAQKYDYGKSLWHRVELNGSNIGIDPTYNHHVWFAACACRLSDFCKDNSVDDIIKDFLTNGIKKNFRIYRDGLLYHHVNILNSNILKVNLKRLIKMFLIPISFIYPKKLNLKYLEYAYHIFDIFGFSILREKYPHMSFFNSEAYRSAVKYASNIKRINEKCGAYRSIENGDMFNVYSYSYNSPAFEYPYVAEINGFANEGVFNDLYDIQKKLMYNAESKMFSRNNPDVDTWNARVYEIVRYLDMKRGKQL